MDWSYELIIVEMCVVLVGRFLATFGLIGLLKLCKYENGNAKRITCKELLFIWYAGLIRGAIAFGLVLRIDYDVPNRDVIVTTCLTLVVFTTIFFGSTVGVLGKCLFPEPESDDTAAVEVTGDGEGSMSSFNENESSLSSQVRQPLMHYNEKKELEAGSEHPTATKESKKRTCGDYVRRFDELIMRPLLIHKYEANKEERVRDFYDLYQAEGNAVRKLYETAKTKKAEESERGSAHHGGFSEKKDE